MTPIPNPVVDERVIYHYCDANALLSILSNEQLWFTHAAYLDDTMEIARSVEICRRILDERLEQSPDDPVLSSTRSYLENAEKWQYYICCFCASNDKLSQWRSRTRGRE